MTARTIHMLLDYLPESNGIDAIDNYQTGIHDGPYDSDIEKFSIVYSDLGIGWKVAQRLAELEMTFPAFVEGSDLFLRNAYLYCVDKNKYPCPHVKEARFLASNTSISNPINSLLLCGDMSYAAIGLQMSVHPNTIAAYEKLFYNVVDRHLDHLFIRNVVYPHGRLVEMYEHYLENEDLGNVLNRVGFNSGAEDVLHFAGFESGLIGALSAQNMPVKLENLIMANGYLLAKNGWAHQREHAAGLSAARNLIAAAKHGGQESQQDSAFTDYGNTLVAELIDIKTVEADSRPVLADGLPGS